MKQPCSPHNRFCWTKKVVRPRLKLKTLMLSAHMQYLSKKKEVVFVMLEFMTFMLQCDALPHRNCPPYHGGAKSKQTLTSQKQTS